MITPTIEEYLETIYVLTQENRPVIAAALADFLCVTPPTVTQTLKRMLRDGYITIEQRKVIVLTETGCRAAESVMRRHRLVERLLVDVLGMSWTQAHDEADRLQYAISPTLEAVLSQKLNHPATCPHGNPIPGNAPSMFDATAQRLTDFPLGARVQLTRISEQAERNVEVLAFAEENDLLPGRAFRITAITPFNGTITLEGDSNKPVVLGTPLARLIWATPLRAEPQGEAVDQG